MEQINLTVPIVKPIIDSYRIDRLEFDLSYAKIEIHLICSTTGEKSIFGYSGQQALTLMAIMNKMNFSVNSMHKTILQKLITDGFLDGSISGTPD